MDIDNTLANTWPTLNNSWSSEYDRIKFIKPLPNILSYIKDSYNEKDFNYIFLTHRNYKFHGATLRWLNSNGYKANFFNVVLVQSPFEKVYLFKKYVKKSIVYFDDVKFYENEIKYISQNKFIKYYDYKKINEIIKNHEQ